MGPPGGPPAAPSAPGEILTGDRGHQADRGGEGSLGDVAPGVGPAEAHHGRGDGDAPGRGDERRRVGEALEVGDVRHVAVLLRSIIPLRAEGKEESEVFSVVGDPARSHPIEVPTLLLDRLVGSVHQVPGPAVGRLDREVSAVDRDHHGAHPVPRDPDLQALADLRVFLCHCSLLSYCYSTLEKREGRG